MSKKHVLIVDDAKDILFLLMHSVKRLGPEYEVTTAANGAEALTVLEKRTFDLVITDFMMGEITGLDLAQRIHKKSPHTQIVLMSAYDTSNLRDTVKDMNLSGYIGKPFTVPQVLDVVQQAVAKIERSPEPAAEPIEAIDKDEAINEPLRMLYNKTGAHYVLLLDAQGHPLRVVGRTERATLSRLATFVASNFLAVTELASLLGDNTSVFKSSYHEGNNYNIYSYDINGDYLLAVVFGSKDKPGTVWFYTKQAAASLAPLLGGPKTTASTEASEAMAEEFEDFMGSKPLSPTA